MCNNCSSEAEDDVLECHHPTCITQRRGHATTRTRRVRTRRCCSPSEFLYTSALESPAKRTFDKFHKETKTSSMLEALRKIDTPKERVVLTAAVNITAPGGGGH